MCYSSTLHMRYNGTYIMWLIWLQVTRTGHVTHMSHVTHVNICIHHVTHMWQLAPHALQRHTSGRIYCVTRISHVNIYVCVYIYTSCHTNIPTWQTSPRRPIYCHTSWRIYQITHMTPCHTWEARHKYETCRCIASHILVMSIKIYCMSDICTNVAD